jgi:hypothetical protein
MKRVNFFSNLLPKRLTFEERFEVRKKEIIEWLNEYFSYGGVTRSWKDFMLEEPEQLIKEGDKTTLKDRYFQVNIYLGEHRYKISASIKEESMSGDKDYLGCTCVLTRWHRGETHHRGRDLPDGKFNKETFDHIAKAILTNEFLPLETSDRDILTPPAIQQEVLDVLDGNDPQEPEPPQLERRWI